jgi:hypothetical protein
MKMKRGTFFWHSPLREALDNVGYEVYLSKEWWADGKRRCFLTEPTEEFPNKDIGKAIYRFTPRSEPYTDLAGDLERDLRGFGNEPRYVRGRGGRYYPAEFIEQHPSYGR